MVAQTDDYLPEVLRGPVPEGMRAVVVIAQITRVASQHENIASHIHGAFLPQDAPVLTELQMKVGCVLNLHSFIRSLTGGATTFLPSMMSRTSSSLSVLPSMASEE